MLAEEQFTLTLFWKRWNRYQDRLKETRAPLEVGQPALRAVPSQRSRGEIALTFDINGMPASSMWTA